MRPVAVAVPASAASPMVPLDVYQKGPITIGIRAITGTPDIDVQYTMDDVWAVGYDPAAGTWITAGAPLNTVSAATAGALVDVNGLAVNPRAVRAINANAASTAQMVVTQAGVMG